MPPFVRSLSTLSLLLSSMSVAWAEPAPPRLIVAIAVDQFSGDLFNEYRAQFSGGIGRLTQGAVFPRGYQSHAATETCPGHSTILTGGRPARTGIVANRWFDVHQKRAYKGVYCAEDERVSRPTGKDDYDVSGVHLKVPTLGDRMKIANPASRVVALTGKDRAAVMMGGTKADGVWWWGKQGFTTYGRKVSPDVATINASALAMLNTDQPGMPLPPTCAAHDYPVALAHGRQVGTGRFARKAGDASAFNASPALDAATLMLAGKLVDSMKLGQQSQTDLLAISLSATDYIGHTFGTEGAEMCLQMHYLDQALGGFFAHLDALGIDYVVMLTADHGGHDTPERSVANAIVDAQRVDPALNASAKLASPPEGLDKALADATKLPGKLIYGDGAFGDMYLAPTLTKSQREEVITAAMKLWSNHPQVQQVFTHAELATAPAPHGPPDTWSLRDEARASFDPERSGDFVVLLKPRVTPIADTDKGYIATHGSPWDYDRRVPILFWRKNMAGFEQANSVETVDIMPTLASLIGLPVAGGEIDGHCLDLDPGEGTSCPVSAK